MIVRLKHLMAIATHNLSLAVPIILVSSLLLGSCSSTPDKEASAPNAPLSGTDEQIFVGDTLEMNYDPNVIMKRAESFHEQEGYAEAIVEYQHFLDLHRNHVLVPYAQYRLALSHFKMIQTIDRDVSPIEQTRDAFIKLIREYPASQYEAEAKNKIDECEDLLAQHHLLVAGFYYRKEAYLAAAKRYKMIIDSYPYLKAAVEAKYALAKTYKELGAFEWSKDWLVTLVREHPRHELRDDGIKMLENLQKENPDLVVAEHVETSNTHFLATSLLPSNQSNASSKVQAPPSLQRGGTHTSAPSHPSMDECALGSWCEASASTDRHSASAVSPAPATVTCQPGTWCE